MSAKSKFFCVAVEGATATDGRKIERSWIKDIAETYDRKTYGARVNMEHIRGFSPNPPFNAYGDVLSVEAREIELSIGGKNEKRLALFAQIEPTPELVALTKAKQKIYTSIEVAPNFADTGKANLVGLAATDSPASLGTDILEFSASQDPKAAALKDMFNSRKQNPDNVFSAAYETTFELETEEPADTATAKAIASFGDKLLAAIGFKQQTPAPANDQQQAPANDTAALAAVFKDGLKEISTAFTAASKATADEAAALRKEFTALKSQIEGTENHGTRRPAASGGDNQVLADF